MLLRHYDVTQIILNLTTPILSIGADEKQEETVVNLLLSMLDLSYSSLAFVFNILAVSILVIE